MRVRGRWREEEERREVGETVRRRGMKAKQGKIEEGQKAGGKVKKEKRQD